MPFKIRNWAKFQHFKDRNPPWIKLHKKILDQRDINLLSDCHFRVLVGLWLIASEDETKTGTLPGVDEIAFRLRISKPMILKALKELKPFLDQDGINPLSSCYQLDEPETETETETETEKNSPLPKTEVLAWWNNLANELGLSKIKSLSDGRWKKFKVRRAEGLWDKRSDIFESIKASSFIREGSWFGFDWVIKNQENWLKIVEGNFKGGKDNGSFKRGKKTGKYAGMG